MKCRNLSNNNLIFFNRNPLLKEKLKIKISNNIKEYSLGGQPDNLNENEYSVNSINEDNSITFNINPGISFKVNSSTELKTTITVKFNNKNNINGITTDATADTDNYSVIYTSSDISTYVENSDAVKQSLIQRLSVIKGELWYQINYGLPLLEKYKSKGVFDATILNIISNHPGVRTINSYSSSVENHTYTFNCIFTDIYSATSELTNYYTL